MEKTVKITIIVAVVVILVVAIISMTILKLLPAKNTIKSEGLAIIKGIPDLVSVYLNIETTGKTAVEAKDKNSEITNTLKLSIMKLGFAEEEIQTQGYNVYPWQEWADNKYIDKGYKASHQIKIVLGDNEISKVGNIIDAGVDSGAIITSINFELSTQKQNEYKALALKQAGEDARIKAIAIAKGVGKELGGLVSVTGNPSEFYPWPVFSSQGDSQLAEVAMAKQSIIGITPSEQEISASVSVVYEVR